METGHGEYKIPGGKLVVVDLKVQQGQMSAVQLSGDFFLEPPQTLNAFNAALESLPVDTSVADMREHLNAVLTADVAMFGLTLDGIIEVVQRALSSMRSGEDQRA